ncbi:MAG: IS66-like element accessory protein TnpA [Pigmentiphaga sp.]|uniref:IS66-like element accessory protein TnpA n=1 Tax=unclassified Pigmentiphaga TaxID=2626614 RepID=UPI000B419A13|nr:transposase [Pigmentiphaga sp. NML080357]OVZ55273.1 hypothetical protein CDO44_23905 [Pigmentiphaga sp. NML080357]
MAGTGRKYQHHPVARKREIVEASLRAGASVALVAREHGVNANQVWAWRKLYEEGRLGVAGSSQAGSNTLSELLAVDVVASGQASRAVAVSSGTLEIEIGSTRLRVTGTVDPVLLKAAIAALRA